MENSESCALANNVEFEINTTHSKKIQMDFVSLVVLIWLPFLEPDVAIFCLMFVLIRSQDSIYELRTGFCKEIGIKIVTALP